MWAGGRLQTYLVPGAPSPRWGARRKGRPSSLGVSPVTPVVILFVAEDDVIGAMLTREILPVPSSSGRPPRPLRLDPL
eukprot:CAMPEP_0183325362 /NCGR_PEP_ID=MMETSP0160_2-20130417/79362_1 /TAXON_ID=2839 ORGANISM="Odontella Sinensis, Strain Grunow 1884" /NCGR_SAMPLE_ID=MMETSP0160_2 /ASSEMBLY_ACC=CAM_ASM_000250 /LENGTH=77 /DNA_ID=CAMNT_0025493123 /DNA_START=48 /DNA_END=277 /DNA_ORIENTATION=-